MTRQFQPAPTLRSRNGSRASCKIFQPQQEQQLCRDASARIEDNILPASGAGGDEALMPLIEARDKRRHQHGDAGPPCCPWRISQCREGFAPGTERKDTQNGVADDVSAFADEEMPDFKMIPIQTEEVVQ